MAGSGDITNRADNVFKVERVKPEDEGCDAVVTIMKNREFGARGKIKLDFNEPSRQFFPAGEPGKTIHLGDENAQWIKIELSLW